MREVAACFAALVFAALLAAFLVTVPFSFQASSNQFAALLLIAFAIVLGFALALGLPLFLLFRQLGWVNIFSSIAGGFLVGVAGEFILTLGQFNRGYSSSIGGVPHVINGVLTAAGWASYFKTLLLFGFVGALSGLVFWGVWTLAQAANLPSNKLAQAADLPSNQVPQTADQEKHTMRAAKGLALAALFVTGLLIALPFATQDRSCHARIGRALVHLDLSIPTDDWPRLVQLFQDFGIAHAMSFRNSGRDEFGERRVLALSLCNEAGASVTARQELWAAGIGISINHLRDGAGSAVLANELVANLDRLWPGATQFRDARGQIISRPR